MFYVLRNDTDNPEEFGSTVKGFKDEKEAYKYACAQCMQFPFATFVLVEFKGEYKAKVVGPDG